jgi:hypothetical protein
MKSRHERINRINGTVWAPEFKLFPHRLEVPLHSIHADRDRVDQREGLRMLGEHRHKRTIEGHIRSRKRSPLKSVAFCFTVHRCSARSAARAARFRGQLCARRGNARAAPTRRVSDRARLTSRQDAGIVYSGQKWPKRDYRGTTTTRWCLCAFYILARTPGTVGSILNFT